MNRVVSEKLPVEKAVDELIARIKEVAGSACRGQKLSKEKTCNGREH